MSGDGVHNPTDTTQLEADIAELAADIAIIDGLVDELIVDVAAVQATVDLIEAVTNALPVLSETGGTVTTDGTEQNIYVNTTPLGVFRPVCVKIDFTNHTATETVIVRTYYQITAGVGLLRLQDEVTYAGLVDPPLINIDLEPNRFGVRVTIEKTAGTNRAYPWEAFYEI